MLPIFASESVSVAALVALFRVIGPSHQSVYL